jgi:uncharacterized membrane-anchored protein YitT (DUF2179 family)
MRLNKKNFFHNIWPWILITFGAILSAAGYVIFILPRHMVEGGVTGIGIVVKHVTGLPIVGTSSLVITGFVFIIAFKILGKGFGAKSIYATILMNIALDIFLIVKIPTAPGDNLLAAIYGGGIVGFGLGLIYISGASTGGSDAIAQILWKLKKIPIGKTLIVIDIFVLGTASIIFIPFESIMYSMIFIFVEIKVIDMVLNGINASQRIMILTDKPDEMKEVILSSLNRGITIFKGIGAYSGKEKLVLTSVVPKKKIPVIRRIIASIDERAFVIVQDVHQVYGEGFEPLPEKYRIKKELKSKK